MPDGAHYDDDFYLWTRDQAERLRAAAQAGSNVALDWENLAEEIESVGRSEQRELVNRLTIILVHLLKLRDPSAALPRNGWIETVVEQRMAVAALIADSPSLRPRVLELRERVTVAATGNAARALRNSGEGDEARRVDMKASCELYERLLDDSFFPVPST